MRRITHLHGSAHFTIPLKGSEEFKNLRIASQFMPRFFEYFDDEFRLFQAIFSSNFQKQASGGVL